MFPRHSFLRFDPAFSLACSVEGGGAGGGGDFTPDQIDKIQTITAGVLNGAMTARFKSFEKQLHEQLGKTIGDQLKEHLSKAPPAKEEEPEGKQGKKERQAAPGDNVEMNTLRQQLTEMNRRLEAADRTAQEERAKNRTAVLRQKLSDELARIGVTNADAQKIAIGHLVDSKQAVKFDVDGGNEDQIVFLNEDGVPMKLDVGLRNWSKTPEAKFFLPSTSVKGAGTRPGGFGPNGHAPALSREEIEARVWAGVTDELSK